MTKNKEKQKLTKRKDIKGDVWEYPKPPPEHTYELKMEKRLKRIVKGKDKSKLK